MQVDGIAVFVTENLNFHMPSVFEELLDVDSTVAKGSLGFLLSAGDCSAQCDFVVGRCRSK